MSIDSADLDRWITGNWGQDQIQDPDEDEQEEQPEEPEEDEDDE